MKEYKIFVIGFPRSKVLNRRFGGYPVIFTCGPISSHSKLPHGVCLIYVSTEHVEDVRRVFGPLVPDIRVVSINHISERLIADLTEMSLWLPQRPAYQVVENSLLEWIGQNQDPNRPVTHQVLELWEKRKLIDPEAKLTRIKNALYSYRNMQHRANSRRKLWSPRPFPRFSAQ
jgi:hypothetical protein